MPEIFASIEQPEDQQNRRNFVIGYGVFIIALVVSLLFLAANAKE